MKILVIGPSWVGDMCMAQVLFKVLKQLHPKATIDVLAPQWSEALLTRMPEVNSAITLPFGHGAFKFWDRVKFGRTLQQQAYDWAIVLPNSWKSAVIPWAAKIPKRTGWIGEARYGLLNDYRKLDKSGFPLMIQRFAALANFKAPVRSKESLPIPVLQANTLNSEALSNTFSLDLAQPVLIICPGAEYGATKMWPAEYYASLASQYLLNKWQVWVLGSPNDTDIAIQIKNQIVEDTQFYFDFVGQTQLADAVDLLAMASLVVANDSGLMHIASALNRKTLAIYGSTSPAFTPPLGSHVKVAQVEGLYCSPCFKRTCGEGHLRCLKDLPPSQVKIALDELSSH